MLLTRAQICIPTKNIEEYAHVYANYEKWLEYYIIIYKYNIRCIIANIKLWGSTYIFKYQTKKLICHAGQIRHFYLTFSIRKVNHT